MEGANEPFGFVPFNEYLSLGDNKVVYLVEPLLPVGGSMLLFAREKVGKSALAIQLMHALAGGAESWVGFPILTHGRVLYLQVDTPRSTWIRRFKILKGCGWAFSNDCVWNADAVSVGRAALDITNPEHVKELRGMVEDVMEEPVPEGADYSPTPVAVFIDTVRRIHLGDENSSGDQQELVNIIQTIAYPAAVVLIAHERKPPGQGGSNNDIRDASRGSGAISGAVDIIIRMKASKKEASFSWMGRDLQEGQAKLKKNVLYAPEDAAKKHGVLTWELEAPSVKVANVDEEVLRLLGDKGLGSKHAIALALKEITKMGRTASINRVNKFIEKNKAMVMESRPDLMGED